MKRLTRKFNRLRVIKPSDALLIMLLLPIMSFGCSSKLELISHWPDREITIDGESEEWQDSLTLLEKDNVSLGFFNDEEFLYVSLVTTDRRIQRQFMALGFTIWFDPRGGQNEEFGIRFPLGMMETGLMMREARSGERNIERLKEEFEKSLDNLEILGAGKNERRLLRVTDLKGIEIKVNNSNKMLVYEIKVPLIKSEQHPYAIGAEVGESIGLGFETGKLDVKKMRERIGRGMRGRRPPGGIGGGRGRMGGPRPPMPEQFKVWATVRLVAENDYVPKTNHSN